MKKASPSQSLKITEAPPPPPSNLNKKITSENRVIYCISPSCLSLHLSLTNNEGFKFEVN